MQWHEKFSSSFAVDSSLVINMWLVFIRRDFTAINISIIISEKSVGQHWSGLGGRENVIQEDDWRLWARPMNPGQPSLEIRWLGDISSSATPSSLDKSLSLSGFLIATKMRLLGNAILWAHLVIYRF